MAVLTAAGHVPASELIELLPEVFDLLLETLLPTQEAVDMHGRLLREGLIQPLRESTIPCRILGDEMNQGHL